MKSAEAETMFRLLIRVLRHGRGRWRSAALSFILVAQACLLPHAGVQAETARIIAVGDLHGDWEAYHAIMEAAGLIDGEDAWAGGETVMVQTGDIVDRGPDSRRIITHLIAVQRQARRAGGQVIVLVGNHEAMNRTRDLRFVHPGEYAAFVDRTSKRRRTQYFRDNKDQIIAAYAAHFPDVPRAKIRKHWEGRTPLGMLEHQRAWGPGGKYAKWTEGNPAVVMVGNSLFLHGGLSAAYAEMSLKEINAAVKSALKSGSEDLSSIIHAEDGPLWYRGYFRHAKPDEAAGPGATPGVSPEEMLTAVLARYGAVRMIVGHTPSRKGIKARFGGRLIQIDTGASAYYGGTRSFLRIEGGMVYAHDGERVRQLGEADE